MAEEWTARGSLAGLEVMIRVGEIRGGHADKGEYVVLALKGTPDLERAIAPLAPWLMLNPWQPWLVFWRAAWAPWLALAAPPDRRGRP